ncbi:nucleoside diphosphate-linked moiety X motif 19-like isoform X1 [Arapaima gigas]
MNVTLKHWKEAATVILAAGTKHRAGGALKHGNVSASGSPHQSTFDFEVLLLKRSADSGFMPNAYVFPGGLVDSSDFSAAWLDVFKSFCSLPRFGLAPVRQHAETRPPIFATDRAKLGSSIPGEVALRICALRETFEESGVLLAVPAAHVVGGLRDRARPPLAEAASLWDTQVLGKWRSLVTEDPLNFIRMCQELQCVPNIWALHEWSNWLTPSGARGSQRRYDTAFFMCCLREIPHTAQDQKEIVHFKWSTPLEVLHNYQARKIWIAPPQFYELGRMYHFPLLQQLHTFAQERALEGCEQWLPVRLVTADSFMTLLPGDWLYPETLEQCESSNVNRQTEKTLEELQPDGAALHRIVFHDPHTATVVMNITPRYKHLVPFLPPTSTGSTKISSQL